MLPGQLAGDTVIQFRCHKDIDCFNTCCKNIDNMLTPFDILRLKKRLGITSAEFLRQYTEPFDRASDALVQEVHCHGDIEDRKPSIDEFSVKSRDWKSMMNTAVPGAS